MKTELLFRKSKKKMRMAKFRTREFFTCIITNTYFIITNY